MGCRGLPFHGLVSRRARGWDFSDFTAPEAKENREWSVWKITLAGIGVLAALGLSNYFLGQTGVWFFLFSLLILGWCLTLLEDHLPRPSGDQVLEPSALHRFSFPWAAVAILLCGSFFLFYRWDFLHIGYDTDGIKSLELAEACVAEFTTPYVDAWAPGNPIFPYFLMGMFFKLVGISFENGVLFIALLNLAGFLFFYGLPVFTSPSCPPWPRLFFSPRPIGLFISRLGNHRNKGDASRFLPASSSFFSRAPWNGAKPGISPFLVSFSVFRCW